MIVYEIILRPVLLLAQIPYLINLQRSLVIELAVAHFEPAGVGFNYWIVNGPGGLRDLVVVGVGVDSRGGLCDRGVACCLDGSRRMADGAQGRVRNTSHK